MACLAVDMILLSIIRTFVFDVAIYYTLCNFISSVHRHIMRRAELIGIRGNPSLKISSPNNKVEKKNKPSENSNSKSNYANTGYIYYKKKSSRSKNRGSNNKTSEMRGRGK
jgi:hypothetical protein